MPSTRRLHLLLLLSVAVFSLAQVSRGQFNSGGSSQPQVQAKPPVSTPPPKPIKPIPPGSVNSPPNVYFPVPSEREEKLLGKLDETVELSFTDTPLADVVFYLIDKFGIAILIDREKLNEEGIATDSPITFQAEVGSRPLRVSLEQMLTPLALDAVLTDGVLTVTTMDESRNRLITRVYPVGDLTDFQQPETHEELAQIIQEGTRGPWFVRDQEGGKISISHSVRALVIRQSRHCHDEIVELLKLLRAARDVE